MARTLATLILACVSPVLSAVGIAQSPHADAPGPPSAAAPVPDRAALQQELQHILAQPDFRRAMRAGGRGSQDALRWLLARVRRLFERLGGLHQTNYALFLASVIVGSALLLALLAHIAYTISRALRSSGGVRGRSAAEVRERAKTPDEWVREAETFASRGEFREAIRALYLGLTRRLQLAGLLPRMTSQTNWEQLHQLRAHEGLVTALRPFTETFDAKWYGRRAADAQDVERCRGWFEAALREVETP